MKVYVSRDCEDSVAVSVAASLAQVPQEIVPADSRHIPFLRTTRQVPSLELDSGEFLFSLDSILFFLSSESCKFPTGKLCLEQFNRDIPASSLHGENEELSVSDMILWSKLAPSLRALRANKQLYSHYPRVGFWFDKVESSNLMISTMKNLGYTPPKSVERKTKPGKVPAPKATKPAAVAAVENFLQVMVEENAKSDAVSSWTKGYPTDLVRVPEEYPKRPIQGAKNNLITSALPYVNNVPHLGNIIGAVLSGDCFARYCRLKNENTLYICGTDEYGTATETKALAEGLTPQQICDKYNTLHAEIYSWFNISFDFFGRTTTSQQTEIAQDIFWKLHNNGYTVAETVEQLYCAACSKFLADRFVEGVCPHCAYEDARGDQCDKCSKLINPIELGNPRCKVCSASPDIKTSRHLFLDLPQLEKRIQAFTDEREERKTYNTTTIAIANSWLKTGLKPRCITRDLKWGTPVPHPEYSDKVFYVWFDAPIGYISITANYMKDWEVWWKNPENVRLTQFMAKDNVPFHAVVFPASLMATGDNWTMVDTLDGIDWLQYEGTKFSKSRGTGVFGDQVMETNIPCDIFRCYLLLNRPETSDTNFTWDGLALTNNSILLNNLGNFLLRALTFCKNSFNSTVGEVVLNEDDRHFITLVNRHLASYYKHFEERAMSRAFESVFAISKIGNQYLQYNTPWVLVKGTPADCARAGSVISLAVHVSALLSVILCPFMPTIGKVIQEQLELPEDRKLFTKSFVPLLPTGHVISTPFPLFSKIENETVDSLKSRFGGTDSSTSPVAPTGHTTSPPAPSSTTPPAPSTSSPAGDVESLLKQIEVQGGKVRDLKAAKAEAADIKAAVAKLLELKGKLPAGLQEKKGGKQGNKGQTKPQPKAQPKQQNPAKPKIEITPELAALQKEIEVQGGKVRTLKSSGAGKVEVDAAVKLLLELKAKLPAELQPQPAGKKGKKKK